MNRRVFVISAVCAIVLSSCVQNYDIDDNILEEESMTATTSVTEFTTEITTTETEPHHTVTEFTKLPSVPEVNVSELKAVFGEKSHVALECKIIDDIMYENEADFPNKADILTAKKLCFADEADIIKNYNDNAVEDEGYIPIDKAEDIAFSMGASYDFDSDGENESVIFLDYTPAPSWFWGESATYYIDGDNAVQLSSGGNPHGEVYAFDFGIKHFFSVVTYAGASGIGTDVYSLDNGMPEEILNCNWIKYKDGIFYCTAKYEFADYPVIVNTEGVFKQLAVKEITEDDFTEHIENGRKYLDYLKSEGKNIDKIFTVGYYCYWLEGENYSECFYVNLHSGEIVGHNFNSPSKDVCFTKETDDYTDLTKLYTTYIGYPAIMTGKYIEHSFSDSHNLPPKPENLNAADIHVEKSSTELSENIKNLAIDCLKNSESYVKTSEALKKSEGKYILGSIVPTADTDENFCPKIYFNSAVWADFDGDGKEEYFVVLSYFDLEPEFVPYETSCCVYVNSDGNAELLIPKSTGLSVGILRGDEICHVVFQAGINNTTQFVSIYSVKDGKPQIELEEWLCIDIKDKELEFWNQVEEYYAVYDLNREKYVLFKEETDSE